MSDWAGLALVLGVLAPLLGCVLTHFEQTRAASWRADGLVRVYGQGKAVRTLCLQPVEPLPSYDVVVLPKLMIQGNEHEYVQQARHFPALFPDLDCS